MTATLIPFDESLPAWERAFYAFLAEKERRSGSRRTVDGYSRMLQHFFGALGKPPDKVTSQEVFVYAHGPVNRLDEANHLWRLHADAHDDRGFSRRQHGQQ
ncbi:MAG: hypothetical protein ABSB57_04750 [Dehalococcoidia bacterium]|jgi:hypothetical protein